jgi:hypothetical protein
MAGRRGSAVVVIDTRFEQALRFADAATRHYGLRVLGFAVDATALWHERLVPELSKGNAVIGLTAGGVRFCLQLMAGPGVRCVHHVTHTGSGPMPDHVCWTGQHGLDQDLRCAQDWPEQAARIAADQAMFPLARRIEPAAARTYPAYRLPDAEHLESWVFAPAPAAARRVISPFAE